MMPRMTFRTRSRADHAASITVMHRGSSPDGAGDLGYVGNEVQQPCKVLGGGGRTQLDRVGDAGRYPRFGVEASGSRYPHSVNRMPSLAASRYMSLRTHPAAARCNRWALLKAASTVTPSAVQRCGKCTAWALSDLNDPVPTTTSNLSIGCPLCARRHSTRDVCYRLCAGPGRRRRPSATARAPGVHGEGRSVSWSSLITTRRPSA